MITLLFSPWVRPTEIVAGRCGQSNLCLVRFGAIAEWRVQLGDRIVVTHEDGQCRSGRSQEV